MKPDFLRRRVLTTEQLKELEQPSVGLLAALGMLDIKQDNPRKAAESPHNYAHAVAAKMREPVSRENRERLRAIRREHHECVTCGTPLPPDDSFVTCISCREKRRV